MLAAAAHWVIRCNVVARGAGFNQLVLSIYLLPYC